MPLLLRLLLLANTMCFLCGCTNASTPPQDGSGARPEAGNEQIAAARESADPVRGRPIARVLGHEIFEQDLAPPSGADLIPAEADLKSYGRERLQSLIWQPLMDKYCLEHHLQPTNKEIEQYEDAMGNLNSEVFGDDYLQMLRAAAESDELTESERRDSEELLKLLEAEGMEPRGERLIRYWRSKIETGDLSEEERRECAELVEVVESMQLLPAAKVKWWKFDRALHEQYGGVVIFQQSNPCEPVGAYRKWLESHERAGDFEIFDESARAKFWEYFKRDWNGEICVVHESDPLGQPWWLKSHAEEAGAVEE